MKPKTLKPASLILFALFLFACSKPEILPPPENGGGVNPLPVVKGSIRFQANMDLTGQPYHSSNLHAVVTIINENNQEVVKDSTLFLSLDGLVTTGPVTLPVGHYRLAAFRLVYGSVNTHFAAPKAGSPKAALVQSPLAFAFSVEEGDTKKVPVEVLKVQAGEKPGAYGYPAGSFDDGQNDNDPYLKIKIRGIMQIGDVLYDSLPSVLRITTTQRNGEETREIKALEAGINEVQLKKSAVKYELVMIKWGTTNVMELDRQDVDDVTVYTIGGSKAARKLKSERVYRQVNGVERSESKNDYFYDADGRLSKVEYWMRKADYTPYLAMTDEFEYQSGRVSRINRFDKVDNKVITVTSFSYDNQQRVSHISQNDNGRETQAAVEYYAAQQQMKIHYTYPGFSYDMNYFMTFDHGNLQTGNAFASNSGNELAGYQYDMNINPYRHLNWPNLFLTNLSRNNVVVQSKSYSGSLPQFDAYQFQYTYDTDGYPTELLKKFKTNSNNQYAFSTRTVFVY